MGCGASSESETEEFKVNEIQEINTDKQYEAPNEIKYNNNKKHNYDDIPQQIVKARYQIENNNNVDTNDEVNNNDTNTHVTDETKDTTNPTQDTVNINGLFEKYKSA